MKVLRLTSIWITIGWLVSTSVRGHAEEIIPFSSLHAQFLAFVQKLPIIRIGITNGAEMGNQAAGLVVYRRLRELGYRGHIEIVYEDYLYEKLAQMMPGLFYGNMGDRTFEYQQLRLVNASEFQNNSSHFEQVQIAIIGARDRGKGAFGAPDGNLGPQHLNARILLQLQPAQWDMGSRAILDGSNSISLERFSSLGFPHSPPDPYPLDIDYVYEALGISATNHSLRDGLVQFVHLFGHTDIGAVYGHGVELARPLIQYLAGIRGAFLENSQLFPHGVVVPVFNEMSFSKDLVRTMIETHADTLGTIRTIDISDPHLRQTGESLKAGEILVVYVGTVPQQMFEVMYDKSTVPPLVKGLNSIDVMRTIGRPYLPTDTADTFHLPAASYVWPSPRARLLVEAARKAMLFPVETQAYITKSELEKIQKTIGTFIRAAMTPESGLNLLFHHYRIAPEDLKKDLLVQGLLAAERHLQRLSVQKIASDQQDWCPQFLKPILQRL